MPERLKKKCSCEISGLPENKYFVPQGATMLLTKPSRIEKPFTSNCFLRRDRNFSGPEVSGKSDEFIERKIDAAGIA